MLLSEYLENCNLLDYGKYVKLDNNCWAKIVEAWQEPIDENEYNAVYGDAFAVYVAFEDLSYRIPSGIVLYPNDKEIIEIYNTFEELIESLGYKKVAKGDY